MLAILAAAVCFQSAPQALPSAQVHVPPAGVRLPLKSFFGRPVVEVLLNGKGPYPFILDTGASTSVLDEDVFRELGMRAEPGMDVKTSTGTPLKVAKVDQIDLAGAKLEGSLLVVMPLRKVMGTGAAFRGILTSVSFPGALLTFDFPKNELRLREGSLDKADQATRFSFAGSLPKVFVKVGEVVIEAQVDTGSGDALVVPKRFLSQVPITSEPRPGKKIRLMTGDFPTLTANTSVPVKLGSYELGLKELVFCDLKPGKGAPIGNMGAGVLKDFVVTVDAKNHVIEFSK